MTLMNGYNGKIPKENFDLIWNILFPFVHDDRTSSKLSYWAENILLGEIALSNVLHKRTTINKCIFVFVFTPQFCTLHAAVS